MNTCDPELHFIIPNNNNNNNICSAVLVHSHSHQRN